MMVKKKTCVYDYAFIRVNELDHATPIWGQYDVDKHNISSEYC